MKFLHDKASCYAALEKDGTLRDFFDSVDVAAGKAPDMSHLDLEDLDLDAGICLSLFFVRSPFMERQVEEAG
eukprot:scaffold12822_cov112-Isochrysis_galbana.AAC.1